MTFYYSFFFFQFFLFQFELFLLLFEFFLLDFEGGQVGRAFRLGFSQLSSKLLLLLLSADLKFTQRLVYNFIQTSVWTNVRFFGLFEFGLLHLGLGHAFHSCLMPPSKQTWRVYVWMRVVLIVGHLRHFEQFKPRQ